MHDIMIIDTVFLVPDTWFIFIYKFSSLKMGKLSFIWRKLSGQYFGRLISGSMKKYLF